MASSVSWASQGSQIAIGCNLGSVQIWDINKCKMIRKMDGHEMRIGSMSWNSNILATGSRDKTILQRDMRDSHDYTIKMTEHTQ
jgi:cell division cycle 20-like protein 1 (cofactor of APC complex)